MEEEEYLGEKPKQPRPFVIASSLWQAQDTLMNLDDKYEMNASKVTENNILDLLKRVAVGFMLLTV